MYTGTLIEELIATVERTERRIQLRQQVEEIELHQLFNLPASELSREPAFAGAA